MTGWSGWEDNWLTLSYFGKAAMETIRVSTKGQIVIPKDIRQAHNWQAGQELMVVDTPAGVLLKPVSPFKPTTLAEIKAKKTAYTGPHIPESEWDALMEESMRKEWRHESD